MSRIGKLPISIPAGVTVTLKDNVVTVKGPKGELTQEVNPAIIVEIEKVDEAEDKEEKTDESEDKEENKYCLAPIYDCGNCFYGKTGEERIVSMLSDETKLYSSAINGVTAYEVLFAGVFS